MYSDMDNGQGKVDPSFDKRVWEFINEAVSVARNEGKYIGWVPSFMRAGS